MLVKQSTLVGATVLSFFGCPAARQPLQNFYQSPVHDFENSED
jgi:hypothetical protein